MAQRAITGLRVVDQVWMVGLFFGDIRGNERWRVLKAALKMFLIQLEVGAGLLNLFVAVTSSSAWLGSVQRDLQSQVTRHATR